MSNQFHQESSGLKAKELEGKFEILKEIEKFKNLQERFRIKSIQSRKEIEILTNKYE